MSSHLPEGDLTATPRKSRWPDDARWALLLLYLPTSLVIGSLASIFYAIRFGVWEEYVGAVVLPLVGLLGAWVIAPRRKLTACTIFYFVGVTIAILISPSEYPSRFLIKYRDESQIVETYAPLFVTAATGLLCLLGLALIRKLHTPDETLPEDGS